MPDVSFRISVQGGRESQEEVLAVRQALAGVRSDLDSSAAASRIFGVAQNEVTTAMRTTVLEMSAFGGYTLKGADGMTALGGASRTAHQELFEGARRVRSFVDAVGLAIPGLSEMTGTFTRLNRETQGFTTSQVIATAALLGTAVAIGRAIALGKEYVDAQNAASAAVRSMDFSASTAGLQKSEEAIEEFKANWTRATTDILGLHSTFAERMAARWAAISVGIQSAKGGMTALTDTQEAWATSAQRTWDLQEQGRLTISAMTAELSAEQAQLGLLRARAADIDELSASFAREADMVRALGDAQANQMVRDALALDIRLRAAGLTEEADERMGLVAQQANAKRGEADARATQITIQGALAVAEIRGQQIQMESRLESAIIRRAQVALGAAQAEADATLAAARADAQFFGTSLQGLESYQAERRARIQAEGQLEIADIQQRAAADRAALLERMAAVPQYGAEWQRLNTQLKAQDQETQNAIQAKSAETQNKLRQDANATTEERRANYARERALADQHYRQLEALGQGDVAARIRQLEQVARDENASFETRQGAARDAYSARRQLENELFNLLKANGLITERDAVAHAAAVAASWKQGSSQRLQAEAQFVEQVRALWSSLSQTGGTAMAAVANLLKERFGIVNATLAEQQQFWPQLVAEAQQYLGVWQSGGFVTENMQRQITAVADVQDRLTRAGVNFGQAAGTYFQDLANKLSGTLTPAGELVNQMDRLGIETGQARTVAEQLAGELSSAFGEAGETLTSSFRGAFEEIESSVRPFLQRFRQEMASGLGPIADDFARTVIRAVTQSLDEAAARS